MKKQISHRLEIMEKQQTVLSLGKVSEFSAMSFINICLCETPHILYSDGIIDFKVLKYYYDNVTSQFYFIPYWINYVINNSLKITYHK